MEWMGLAASTPAFAVFDGVDALAETRPSSRPKEAVIERNPEIARFAEYRKKLLSSKEVLTKGPQEALLDLVWTQPAAPSAEEVTAVEARNWYAMPRRFATEPESDGNVTGVSGPGRLSRALRLKRKSSEGAESFIRMNGVRASHDAMIVSAALLREMGHPEGALSREKGNGLGLLRGIQFKDEHDIAPIVRPGFQRNADVHGSYASIAGSVYNEEAKGAVQMRDAGFLIDLSQAPALEKFIFDHALPNDMNKEAKENFRLVLKRSLFMMSASMDSNEDLLRTFAERGTGSPVFAEMSGLPGGNGRASFGWAGGIIAAVRMQATPNGPFTYGYIVAGPDMLNEVLKTPQQSR